MSFDRVAEVYDETRRIPDAILEEFYKTIFKKTRLGQSSIILDAGIGTGRTIRPVLTHGVSLVGIDISRKMLQKLIEKIERIFQLGFISY